MVTLKITDGTTSISLIADDSYGKGPFYLNSWRQAVAQPKGGGVFQQSALSDGRRIISKQWENVIDTFTLHIGDVDQDSLIDSLQDLRELLEKAVQYWTTEWQ